MNRVLCLLAVMLFGAAPMFAQEKAPCPEGEKAVRVVEVVEVKIKVTDKDVEAAIKAIKDGSLDEMIKQLESLPGTPEDALKGLKKLKEVDVKDKEAVRKLLQDLGMKFDESGEGCKNVEMEEIIESIEEIFPEDITPEELAELRKQLEEAAKKLGEKK